MHILPLLAFAHVHDRLGVHLPDGLYVEDDRLALTQEIAAGSVILELPRNATLTKEDAQDSLSLGP